MSMFFTNFHIPSFQKGYYRMPYFCTFTAVLGSSQKKKPSPIYRMRAYVAYC